MITNIERPRSSAWYRAHLARHRRALAITGGIIAATIILAAFGTFGSISWSALGIALVRTAYRLLAAYIIALVLGTTVALLVGWSPFVDAFFPVFDILQSFPAFALIPFFIYFFGFTDEMIILFAASSIVWPILSAVLTAIKNASRDQADTATLLGARGWKRVRSYLAPFAVPAILTGSVVGIAIGWESVIGAEIIANTSGFGAFIRTASVSGIDASALVGLLAILILVFVVNRLVWIPFLTESARHYAG